MVMPMARKVPFGMAVWGFWEGEESDRGSRDGEGKKVKKVRKGGGGGNMQRGCERKEERWGENQPHTHDYFEKETNSGVRMEEN